MCAHILMQKEIPTNFDYSFSLNSYCLPATPTWRLYSLSLWEKKDVGSSYSLTPTSGPGNCLAQG